MGYSNVALKEKIVEIYPELVSHRILVSIDFDDDSNSYIVKLKKGKHQMATYLDKKDSDDCLDGVKCVSLGIKIGEFLGNFER
ncbi:MAG: hypothetical protein HY809_04965 [Nitrospirae bacterium]|nr:hypothetical protein [Nitrospirota bacterium]